jgi:uncharacterized oligopeptide transporter (OPT) family protein
MNPPDKPRAVRADGLFQSRYPEASFSAIAFGVIFGAIMNAAITYSGLKIGFTISGTAIAAVVGFGVLRGILRRGSILEVNIGQTVGSAVNIVNSGIIFTVPVIFLLDYPMKFTDANFWLITLACVAGAILGVAFIVPLRKQMLDIERLRFPTPTAVAAILKSPGAGTAKSIVLAAGVLAGALIYAPAGLPALGVRGYAALNLRLPAQNDPALVAAAAAGSHLTERVDRDRDGRPDLIVTDTTIDIGRWLHFPDSMLFAFAFAPFALGAGYLTGRPGLMVLAGGALAYLVLNPLVHAFGWTPSTVRGFQVPAYALDAFNRPLGIGLLLGGALMGVATAVPSIKEAIKSIAKTGRPAGGHATPGDEMSFRTLVIVALAGTGLLLFITEFMGGTVGDTGWLHGLNPWLARAVIVAVSVAWIWFAGIIISQCAGMTDWSPISGMALITVVLVMMLAGKDDVMSAVMIGAALCVAITCAADMMGDLKTGYLVGAQPRRQQVIQLVVSALGPVITMATLMLIVGANLKLTGRPIGPGTPTVAPQAQALQAVIIGVQGGDMPYTLYGLGALLGVLLGFGSFAGLGVLIGLSMYLPFVYILTYGVGCLTNITIGRFKGRTWAEAWGVPFCAGLIVGEAMLALLINSLVLLRG